MNILDSYTERRIQRRERNKRRMLGCLLRRYGFILTSEPRDCMTLRLDGEIYTVLSYIGVRRLFCMMRFRRRTKEIFHV